MWQGYLVFSTEQSAYLLEGAIKEFRDFEANSMKLIRSCLKLQVASKPRKSLIAPSIFYERDSSFQ